MTHAARIRFDPQTLAALRTSLRVWLLGVLQWLLDLFGGGARMPRAIKLEIGAELAGARAEVLDLIAMTAHRRLRPVHRTGRRCTCAAWADPHVSPLTARRVVTRGLLPRGRSLCDRIAILLDALRNLDALALRLIRRLAAGPKGAWAVIEDVIVEDLRASPAAVAACDTS